jgi:hypothetical protein
LEFSWWISELQAELLVERSNVFDKNLVDPEDIVAKIGYRVPDRLTFPIGLEGYLESSNMVVESYNAIGLDNNAKISFLKSNISQGKVAILIVKTPKSDWYYLHYITVLGYDSDSFHIYDSLVPRAGDSDLTIDLNGEITGNKSIPKNELIKIWNEGNVLNYPKNYNLFAKPKK